MFYTKNLSNIAVVPTKTVDPSFPPSNGKNISSLSISLADVVPGSNGRNLSWPPNNLVELGGVPGSNGRVPSWPPSNGKRFSTVDGILGSNGKVPSLPPANGRVPSWPPTT